VASDLVYLLMDLTQLGAGAVAADMLARYRAAGFALPDDLLRFYGTHRALVRVKIACLALTGEDAPHDAALAATAANYLGMASAAALTVPPALIVMTGLSGTGKSTVAAALARALGVARIATDAVRQELAGRLGLATERWGEGLYAPERTEATYRELFARAGRALAGDAPVILDGTFLDERWRRQAAAVARSRGVPLVLIETICDEDVVMRRLAAREAHPGSLSDATRDTYRRQREAIAAAPPAIPDGAISVRIDTTPETTVDLEPVFAALHREGLVAAALPSIPWWGRESTP
jgi:predicted kinase